MLGPVDAGAAVGVLGQPAHQVQPLQGELQRGRRVPERLAAVHAQPGHDPGEAGDVADPLQQLGGADLTGLLAKFTDGGTISSGELVSASELLRRTGEVPGLAKIMARLGMEGRESFGEAAAVEFALEGLYLMRRLSKDTDGGTSVYGT